MSALDAPERRPAVHHLLALRVENRAGVLVRIAGLFSRRGYNIVSLAVAPTDDERFSRITIVVDVEQTPLQQIVEQLNKLINVVELRELSPADALERELLLATVQSTDGLDRLVEAYGAEVLESAGGRATVTLSGEPAVLDACEAELAELRIVELHRTGRIALPKLDRPA